MTHFEVWIRGQDNTPEYQDFARMMMNGYTFEKARKELNIKYTTGDRVLWNRLVSSLCDAMRKPIKYFHRHGIPAKAIAKALRSVTPVKYT